MAMVASGEQPPDVRCLRRLVDVVRQRLPPQSIQADGHTGRQAVIDVTAVTQGSVTRFKQIYISRPDIMEVGLIQTMCDTGRRPDVFTDV